LRTRSSLSWILAMCVSPSNGKAPAAGVALIPHLAKAKSMDQSRPKLTANRWAVAKFRRQPA
jgi:hypothetical protein